MRPPTSIAVGGETTIDRPRNDLVVGRVKGEHFSPGAPYATFQRGAAGEALLFPNPEKRAHPFPEKGWWPPKPGSSPHRCKGRGPSSFHPEGTLIAFPGSPPLPPTSAQTNFLIMDFQTREGGVVDEPFCWRWRRRSFLSVAPERPSGEGRPRPQRAIRGAEP